MQTSFFRILLVYFMVFAVNIGSAQHYRGLCALNDSTVWLSGSKGYVVRTNNGGKNWDTLNPKGFERKDFRDIHAWNTKEAVVMSSGDSAVMLHTSNGGKSWNVVISDNSPGVFWDAIDVRNNNIILVGDNMGGDNLDIRLKRSKGKFVTPDLEGNHTHQSNNNESLSGMGFNSFYAASGSNVQWMTEYDLAFIPLIVDANTSSYFMRTSGGLMYREWWRKPQFYLSPAIKTLLPFTPQTAGGAYSFRMRNQAEGACVGGSYLLPDKRDSVACYTSDSGKSWQLASVMPNGYRSCVAFQGISPIGVCTGTNGTDLTRDGGINWAATALKGYNVCAFTANYIWLAGNKGTWEKTPVTSLFPK